MKKKVVLLLSLIVITVAVFAICVAENFQVNRCLVTTDGVYMMVDKKGTPIVMDNQSGIESLFDSLNSGDVIIVACSYMVGTSYPGKTSVFMCIRIAKGSLDNVPETTLSELYEMGYTFEGEP